MPLPRTISDALDTRLATLLPSLTTMQAGELARKQSYTQLVRSHTAIPNGETATAADRLAQADPGENNWLTREVADPTSPTGTRTERYAEPIDWTTLGQDSLSERFSLEVRSYRAPKGGDWRNGADPGYTVVARCNYLGREYSKTVAYGVEQRARQHDWREVVAAR